MLQLFKDYIASPTHKWWVDNVWEPTWTKFLTWVYGIPSALAAGGLYISQLAGDNHVQQLLDKVHVPDWVPAVLAIFAFVHYIAAGHDD